ncbi:MAG: CPBP family intramembrane glutamic endopeptidase [Nitrososphaeria archaeon]
MGNPVNQKNTVEKLFSIVVIILLLLVIATMMLSFILGPYVIFNTDVGQQVQGEVQEYYIFILGGLLALPFTVGIQQQFVFEWVICLSIFTILVFSGKENLLESLKEAYANGTKKLFGNDLSAATLIFAVSIAIVLVIDTLQNQIGISSGLPPTTPTNPAEFLTLVSWAPISEEIGFRLSIIGLFSLLSIQGWRVKIPIIEYLIAPVPTLRKIINTEDGKRRVRNLFITLIISSALLFGFLHVTSGWGIGKFSEATAAGVMLGIAYSYYGIGAAILVHWGFNYYLTAIPFFEEQVSNLGLSSFVEIVVLALGIVIIIYYASNFLIHRIR